MNSSSPSGEGRQGEAGGCSPHISSSTSEISHIQQHGQQVCSADNLAHPPPLLARNPGSSSLNYLLSSPGAFFSKGGQPSLQDMEEIVNTAVRHELRQQHITGLQLQQQQEKQAHHSQNPPGASVLSLLRDRSVEKTFRASSSSVAAATAAAIAAAEAATSGGISSKSQHNISHIVASSELHCLSSSSSSSSRAPCSSNPLPGNPQPSSATLPVAPAADSTISVQESNNISCNKKKNSNDSNDSSTGSAAEFTATSIEPPASISGATESNKEKKKRPSLPAIGQAAYLRRMTQKKEAAAFDFLSDKNTVSNILSSYSNAQGLFLLSNFARSSLSVASPITCLRTLSCLGISLGYSFNRQMVLDGILIKARDLAGATFADWSDESVHSLVACAYLFHGQNHVSGAHYACIADSLWRKRHVSQFNPFSPPSRKISVNLAAAKAGGEEAKTAFVTGCFNQVRARLTGVALAVDVSVCLLTLDGTLGKHQSQTARGALETAVNVAVSMAAQYGPLKGFAKSSIVFYALVDGAMRLREDPSTNWISSLLYFDCRKEVVSFLKGELGSGVVAPQELVDLMTRIIRAGLESLAGSLFDSSHSVQWCFRVGFLALKLVFLDDVGRLSNIQEVVSLVQTAPQLASENNGLFPWLYSFLMIFLRVLLNEPSENNTMKEVIRMMRALSSRLPSYEDIQTMVEDTLVRMQVIQFTVGEIAPPNLTVRKSVTAVSKASKTQSAKYKNDSEDEIRIDGEETDALLQLSKMKRPASSFSSTSSKKKCESLQTQLLQQHHQQRLQILQQQQQNFQPPQYYFQQPSSFRFPEMHEEPYFLNNGMDLMPFQNPMAGPFDQSQGMMASMPSAKMIGVNDRVASRLFPQ